MFFLSASSQQEFYKTYVHLKGQSASLGPSQQEFYKTYMHLKGKFASSVASLKKPLQSLSGPNGNQEPSRQKGLQGPKKKWTPMILLKGPCGLLSMSLVVVKGLEVVEVISCKRITSITSSPMPFLYNPLTILPRV